MLLFRMRELIAEQLGVGVNTIQPDTLLVDLDYDSLDAVEFIMTLEEELRVCIDDNSKALDDFPETATVQDLLVTLVGMKLDGEISNL